MLANVVPKNWKKYVVPDIIGFQIWIKDFKNRVEQLSPLANETEW